jgi:glycosyltransferase involved in cell wall biosynthesis
MKTALVCAVQAPFVTGGAEILVGELRDNLRKRGFRVEVVALPFHGAPASSVLRQALAWRLLEVGEADGGPVDLVIPTKFPSYLVRHPRKVAWLFHQHREAYDLVGTPFSSLRDDDAGRPVREAIATFDKGALSECRTVFTISKNVSARLFRYNQLPSTPLYPPPHQVGLYRCDGYGDYLFYAGRLEPIKRLELAIEALGRARSRARLRIAGRGSAEKDLRKLAERLGLADRVEFLGFVPAGDLLALYAGCRAAYYGPVDEDYGYVTVEAFLSRKPVLTTTDAGGPLEFVSDGESGVVALPDPDSVAAGIDRLYEWPETRLREMGALGHRQVEDITWEHVIDRLTDGA